ncbi:hypothetical protein [Sphaerothrix gracilis]|uniref:hypothetical protein n=1 Tax=Sphaerothrix gracilis TaxID=3151835 RepID=UPI0031FC7A4C
MSPYPIGSDVQPLVGLAALLSIGFLWYKDRFSFNKIDLIFIAISILSLTYFNSMYATDFILRKRIGLLFAFLIYYAIRKTYIFFNFKVFYSVVNIYFWGAIAHLLYPEKFSQFGGMFIRVVKQSSLEHLSYRGVSSFCPEPGFLGAISVFLLLVLIHFNKRENIHIFYNISTAIMSISMVLLSKSGTGYIFLAFLTGYWLLDKIVYERKVNYLLTLFSLFLLSAYGLIQISFSGRGFSVFKQAMNNPFSLIQDASVAHRLSNVWISLLSLVRYPLGTGAGSFSFTSSKIYYEYNLYSHFQDVESETTDIVSALAQYNVELGLFFLIFIVIIFCNTYVSSFSIVCRTFSFLFLLASFSVAFPPTWLLLAVTSRTSQNKFLLKGRQTLKQGQNLYLYKQLCEADRR